MGTSPISRAPLRRYWRTCFISSSKRKRFAASSVLENARASRSEQCIQGAGEVHFDPVDRRLAAVVVHEQSMPDFQGERQPDALLPVDAASDMIAHDTTHHVGVVVAAVKAAIGKQYVVDQAAPRPGEPAGQGNGETDFAAVNGLAGNVALGEPLENDLRAQAADLQVLRQTRGELDQLVIEERHAGLDAGSHAHPVAFDQDVVHQSGMDVAIEEAVESIAAVAAIDDLVERLGEPAVSDLVSHRVGKHAGLELRVEASVPRREAARQVGYREDLRHASQTPALEGQAARDAAQERIPNPG